MDAFLPPAKQMEEAEIQKGTNESPLARNGKEKKATNFWDKVDVLALRTILSDKMREHIAKSCYTKVHLDVWKETCGEAELMEMGMLSCWKDDTVPE
jgi:hypothetical protein